MKTSRMLLAAWPLAFAAMAPAIAQDAAAPEPAARYQCGGIGQDEQRQFRNAAARHDAMVTFATPSGSYVSDVNVTVTTSQGAVLAQGVCDGPLMLLDVPAAGRYRITAIHDGQEQRKTVSLGRTSKRVLFTWPAS